MEMGDSMCVCEKTGTVKWFDKKKGWGYIIRDDGREDLFVHHTGIEGKGFRLLEDGDRVAFEEAAGLKGPKAVNVRVI